MRKDEARLEYMAIGEIPPWPRNPKLHDRESTKASITRFGFTAPLLMDETSGQLVAGHGRVEALAELHASGAPAPKRVRVRKDGAWMAPVIRGLSFDSAQEAEAYLLADNRLVEKGGWDDTVLKKMLEDLYATGTDDFDALSGLGWSERDFDALIRAQDDSALNGETPGTYAASQSGYAAAGIKQVVLFFSYEEYVPMMSKFEQAATALGVKSHTDVVSALLTKFTEAAP